MHTGRCMCGAVTFEIDGLREDFGACHCEMCRRWTGSAFLGISVPHTDIRFTGLDRVKKLQSSAWAERAWCDACGTGLWYRVTANHRMAEKYEIPIGLLDHSDHLRMTREIFIDCKPACFAYQGEHRLLTRESVMKLYRIDLDDPKVG
ncbi:MAG: GFA family protein [Alphaproteobacteria bacterium]|nr:GFA family protein [Alphaproteobacteria bacterium]MCB9693238.1 GFA family protein [Alphaproteobacteria bacterium]